MGFIPPSLCAQDAQSGQFLVLSPSFFNISDLLWDSGDSTAFSMLTTSSFISSSGNVTSTTLPMPQYLKEVISWSKFRLVRRGKTIGATSQHLEHTPHTLPFGQISIKLWSIASPALAAWESGSNHKKALLSLRLARRLHLLLSDRSPAAMIFLFGSLPLVTVIPYP